MGIIEDLILNIPLQLDRVGEIDEEILILKEHGVLVDMAK